MSSPVVTLEQLLAELRQLALDVAPIAAHLAAIDAQLAALPQSAEVEALRADLEELKVGFAEMKAFQDGPPPIPDRLKALERDVAAFKIATSLDQAAIAEVAGSPGDAAHRGMARGEASPMIAEAEARSDLQIATMRERVRELNDAVKVFGKVLRENQSAVLVITAVAALVLAGLVLFLISAFGSPLP